MFHFDLDRICWLKVFIYLTDTDEDSGPHEYVETSHQVGAKPQELLNEGYSRISEEKIKKHYKKDILKKFVDLKVQFLLVIQVAITEASLQKIIID